MNTWNSMLLMALAKGAAFSMGWLLLGHLRSRASAMWLAAWWRAGLAGIFLVTMCALLPSVWSVSYRSTSDAEFTANPETGGNPRIVRDDGAVIRPVGVQTPETVQVGAKYRNFLASHGFVALWGLGVLVILARLGLSALRVARIRRVAQPVISDAWNLELEEECRWLKTERKVMLLSSLDVSAPFATGWWRPAIVLPATADAWVEMKRRSVLRHELSHVSRRDLAFVWLAELATAIHWVNPMMWMLRSRLLLAQERTADDAVLNAGVESVEYAAILAEVAQEGRSLRLTAGQAPMARKSTLRRRVSYVLNRAQARTGGSAMWRLAAAWLAVLLSGAVGLTGLRAQETSTAPTWSRTYRDTYRLEKSFAEHFPGASEAALAAFQKELSVAKISVPEGLRLELSADKGALILQYDDRYNASKHQPLLDHLIASGWWQNLDNFKARMLAAEQELVPLKKLLEDARGNVRKAAVKMQQIRQRDAITDADPDNQNAIIRISDPDSAAIEGQLNEQRLKVTKIEGVVEQIAKMKPMEIRELVKLLGMEDRSVSGMLEDLNKSEAKEIELHLQGLGERHPRVVAEQKKKEYYFEKLSQYFDSIRLNQVSLLEIERRNLARLRANFEEGKLRPIQDKQRLNEYFDAKTKYLQAKQFAEGIEARYNTEKIERSIGR